MIQKLIIIVVTGVFAFGSNLYAETINVVGEIFPPMTNEDGTGQQFEIAKAVYETLGYKVKCKTYPYKRARYYVEIEKADVMVGMLKTDSEKLIFAKFPHDADNIIAIYPKNKNIKWDGISTLKNKKLTWARGLGFDNLFDFDHQGSEINTRRQAFQKLLLGRDDFMIDAYSGFLLKEVDSLRNRFETRKIGFILIYCCFSNTEKGKRLKKIWDKEFLQIIETGKAESVYKKWKLMREYRILTEYLDEAGKTKRASDGSFYLYK